MKKGYVDPRERKRIPWLSLLRRGIALILALLWAVAVYGYELISVEKGLCLVAVLFTSIFLSRFFHELGHWGGGLYQEYYFLSFRLGPWTLILDEEARWGFALRKHSFPKSWGQCIMTPNEEEDYHDIPFDLYLLGGGFANLATIPLALVVLLFTLSHWYYATIFIVVALLYGLCSLLPLSLAGVHNDAMIRKLCHQAPEHHAAFISCLRIQGSYGEGISIVDMPENWFYGKFSLSERMTANPMMAQLWAYTADRFLMNEELFQGKIIYEALSLQWDLGHMAQQRGVFQFLNTMLLEGRVEEVRIYPLPKYMRKSALVLEKSEPLYSRYRHGYSKLVSGKGKGMKDSLAKFEKLALSHPLSVVIDQERQLIERLDEVVILK